MSPRGTEATGRATDEHGDEGTETGETGTYDAHGWFGGGPDGGVDVVPEDVEGGEAGEDDEADDAYEADAGEFMLVYGVCGKGRMRDETYKPAQPKIPVNTPFCDDVVRSRHSSGSGWRWWLVAERWQMEILTYKHEDEEIENAVDGSGDDQDVVAVCAMAFAYRVGLVPEMVNW